MTRINVTEYDPFAGRVELVGWFNLDKATEFGEASRWDGSNNVSVPTGSWSEHQVLYRTAGGRWVLHCWSQWQGTTPKYEYLDDESARRWLVLNGHASAVAVHFGPVEDERGPGRPEIGGAVHVRLGTVKEAVVDYAATHGMSVAGAVRELVAAGLKAGHAGS